jgi:FkbM family methyltransferase
MKLTWGGKWGRELPRPFRALLTVLVTWYHELRPVPLGGDLTGCFMKGEIPRSYREGTYEPEVCRILKKLVQPGWVCVDVGAHLGYFTLLLAGLVRSHGRVIVFEAHPGNAEQLRTNVKINGFESRVEVENLAIGNGIQPWVELFPGRGFASAEWNTVGHDVQGNLKKSEFQVPATSLDSYFPAGSRVDLVKMDIEGAEADALLGMRRLLGESRPLVLVEFHDETGWAGRAELFSADYDLYSIGDRRWLTRDGDVPRVYHCLAVKREGVGAFGS